MNQKSNNLLSSGTKNVIQSFYDNFLQANAEKRASVGYKTTISREMVGGCCEWCAAVVGTWDIDKAPKDVYRRHRFCDCVVTVHSAKEYTDVWSKKTYSTKKEARIARANAVEAEKKKDTEEKSKIRQKYADTFYCYGDYLWDEIGSAIENNRDELETIIEAVKNKGGSVIFTENEGRIITNVFKGRPGEIVAPYDVSIAGIKHEYRHFLDDLDNNCPGLAWYLQNTDEFYRFEIRGYEEELAIAKEKGYIEAEKKIRSEMKKRKEEIYGRRPS